MQYIATTCQYICPLFFGMHQWGHGPLLLGGRGYADIWFCRMLSHGIRMHPGHIILPLIAFYSVGMVTYAAFISKFSFCIYNI